MKQVILNVVGILAVGFVPAASSQGAPSGTGIVGFRYSPPEWQTAICLPDDPHKTLVDRSGELLYHYGQGGREFATRVGVEVVGSAVWRKQELLSLKRTGLAEENQSRRAIQPKPLTVPAGKSATFFVLSSAGGSRPRARPDHP